MFLVVRTFWQHLPHCHFRIYFSLDQRRGTHRRVQSVVIQNTNEWKSGLWIERCKLPFERLVETPYPLQL